MFYRLTVYVYLIIECPHLSVHHAVIHGNMNTDGARRKVVCNAGTEYEFSVISTCTNGAWTNIPSCRIGNCSSVIHCHSY